MHLMRIGAEGSERPVVRIDEHSYVDVSDIVPDFDEAFFAAGGPDTLRKTVTARLDAGHVHRFQAERIGAPIARPHQILGVGLNYRTTDQVESAEPLVFTKAPNSLSGPYDPICIPRGSTQTDWEVELGVVIGKRSHYLADETAATAAIAGYVLVNDISERTFQKERGGQWVKGKSAPTFNPCGPWLATPDAMGDTTSPQLWLEHNGIRRQYGSTEDMIFSAPYIIHHLSQFMVLEPGDLINTGTPYGAGKDLSPPQFMRPGDTLTCGADGLGSQHQTAVTAR
ncbi:fumarylacetoacetate hydrolase family protein [Streptomyces sp. NPDC051217]|uniref:fumarylacetoacetate hydrolase family protein n=1 Tax=Streptomyces sp. NPDC051217 TaxID=3365644 RepID=UPI0037888BCC